MGTSGIYDVVVIGGGVTGTGVLYVFSDFTNVPRMALIEKYEEVAQVNSHPSNNSQTLHFGDIETNYPLGKALPVQDAAQLMMNYVQANPAPGLYRLSHKMVLAVGAEEVSAMRARYAEFLPHYPGLELLEAPDLARLEPKVMEGRDPGLPVVALLSRDGYAVNFKLLSESFLKKTRASGKEIDTFFNTEVRDITRQQDGSFIVRTNNGRELRAKAVVVAAGPYSMLFAQAMGYVPELAFLPVAGSFYFTDMKLLNGKVYTVQTPELPFAAVHADPDVATTAMTRFGPTAKVIPMIERHRYDTLTPYLRTPIRTLAGLVTLLSIARSWVVTRFIVKNFFYDWPLVGKWLYLRQMRKIIPTLGWRQVRLGKKMGGLRPQIVDTKKHTMLMGDSTIVESGIIFNTTPSPGASVALWNAEKDVQEIVRFLGDGYMFDQAAFNRELRQT